MVKENAVNPVVIAIDGYSSCGKSSFAKKLAKLLNFTYVDSGAMYRAVTLYAMQQNIEVTSEQGRETLIGKLSDIEITFNQNSGINRGDTLLNGENVEREIRSVAVSANVSETSKIPEVRDKLVNLQRKIAGELNIIMDGRDIGTTVFPDADIKVFMTASPEIRAQRRHNEYMEKGLQVSYKEILENIKQRDYLDENRDVSPLHKAEDALLLDNSRMSPPEQVEWIKPVILQKTGISL